MTTTGEIPILEPKEEELKPALSKEKLDSLKKAREERSRKVKAINEKELNIIHSLENIYNTLSTLDSRLNTLDNHVRIQSKRVLEEPEVDAPISKKQKTKEVRFETEEDGGSQPMEIDEDSFWDHLKSGAALVSAFIVARFASDYINSWARNTTEDKDHRSMFDYSVYN